VFEGEVVTDVLNVPVSLKCPGGTQKVIDFGNGGIELIKQGFDLGNKCCGVNEDIYFGSLDLLIKSASVKAAEINIFIDAATFITQIKTLFDQFNASISKINNLLSASRTFKRDGDIQDIRNDLTLKHKE
jgi:hypothetical protein